MICNTQKEIWKPLVGYEDRYLISSFGRVISLAYRGVLGPEYLKSTQNYAGYHVLTLGRDRKQHRLSVLVLETFVGPRPEGYEACHNDSNKDNNRLDNLRWDTKIGNIADRRSYVGEANPRAKIKDADVARIIDDYQNGKSKRDLALMYGVSASRINQIIKAKKTLDLADFYC